MSRDISAERISHVIGLIYDCGIEPARWHSLVDDLRIETGLANSMLSVGNAQRAEFLISVTSGVDLGWKSRVEDYTSDIIAAWGGPDKLLALPIGEPIVASEVIGREALQRNRYLQEWALPQSLCDSVMITLAREQNLIAHIAFGITIEAGGLSEQQREILRLLSPHLRRAVSIARLLDMRALTGDTFEAALDSVSLPVLLVDHDAELVYANVVAEAVLRCGDPVHTRNGRLALSSPLTTTALADAVQRAGRNESDLGQRGLAIPTRHRDGAPALIHVLPLPRKDRAGVQQRAVAAVFVARASAPPQMPTTALALLYDLTPAETRVLELIVEGLAPAEIARQLGVTLATTKTHLQRVFDKTGYSRQADLVRLVGSLVLPV